MGGFCPPSLLEIATVDNSADIANLAVLKNYRRQGFGSVLLNAMLCECKNKNINNFFLEVRESNTAAQNLYNIFNFKKIGIRKNYYKNPKEDALIMNLCIS